MAKILIYLKELINLQAICLVVKCIKNGFYTIQLHFYERKEVYLEIYIMDLLY